MEEKGLRYKVIKGINTYDVFIEEIIVAVSDGWEPTGGIAVVYISGNFLFWQAMIKKGVGA